jgi:hypothetical protein
MPATPRLASKALSHLRCTMYSQSCDNINKSLRSMLYVKCAFLMDARAEAGATEAGASEEDWIESPVQTICSFCKSSLRILSHSVPI